MNTLPFSKPGLRPWAAREIAPRVKQTATPFLLLVASRVRRRMAEVMENVGRIKPQAAHSKSMGLRYDGPSHLNQREGGVYNAKQAGSLRYGRLEICATPAD
ncbi:MAG: hypothetical protein AB1705_14435 [Verrucomicrobiota bacterium]